MQLPGSRCSNCISCNFDCKYVEAAKVRAVLTCGWCFTIDCSSETWPTKRVSNISTISIKGPQGFWQLRGEIRKSSGKVGKVTANSPSPFPWLTSCP